MAKHSNQKLKILYLMKIMEQNTDDKHGLTMGEIITALRGYGIDSERKSLYDDFDVLRTFGMDIQQRRGKEVRYHLASRDFELPELKLLVDSVQSSKFITHKKSRTLIRKIENLLSRYEAKELQRQVFVANRIKAMNESIYYVVDDIHKAISEDRQISFQYYEWNVKKQKQLRKNGQVYKVSPWVLTWDDENYYMIGYDTEAQLIKHYRVDKMLHIRMSDESREGKEHFKKLDMADYAKKSFGMFRGKETSVKMLVNNSLAGVIIDRFGKDVMMIPEDEDHFRVNVDVHVSKQFLGWVFSLGEAVKIIGPDEVVEQMRGEVRRLMEQYGE